MFGKLVVIAVLALALGSCSPEKGMARIWDYPPDDAGTDSGTDTDTDTGTSANPCAPDEIHDTDHDLCWSACPLGMDRDGDSCTGTATEYSGAAAQTACSGSHRLPTLNDFQTILDNCDADSCDSCADSGGCSGLLLSDVHAMELWTDDACSSGSSPDAGTGNDGLETIDLAATDWTCIPETAAGNGVFVICVSDPS